MRRIAWMCAVSVALLSSDAFADPKEEQAGKALFAEANQLYAGGDYVSALERFEAAYARLNNPKILLNIGTTQKSLGRYAEAAATYEKYLKEPKADPGRKAEVDASLKEVLQRVATLRIQVEGDPARVTVDGREVGRTPGTVQVRVDRGPHTVVADDGRGAPRSAEIDAAAGEERVVTLSAREQPKADPTADRAKVVNERGTPSAKSIPTLSYVLVGVGVVAAGAGGYFALQSKSQYDKAASITKDPVHECGLGASASTCLSQRDSANDKGDSSKTGAAIGFALGAAAIAGGVAYALISGGSDSPSTLSAVVGGGISGVMWRAQW